MLYLTTVMNIVYVYLKKDNLFSKNIIFESKETYFQFTFIFCTQKTGNISLRQVSIFSSGQATFPKFIGLMLPLPGSA